MDFIINNMSTIIFSIFLVLGLIYLFLFMKDFLSHRKNLEKETKWGPMMGIGFVTNFFDALGIGSFATITASVKVFKQVRDKHIPGILNVGLTIPVIAEAMIFIKKVEVQPLTLFGMLASAAIGAYIGAGIISRFSEQRIRLVIGVALLGTAVFMILGLVGLMPVGGTATGLSGGKLVIAIACNFVLGALMTAGIGMYASCMALIYFLGMNPLISFPIMMGSSAVLMPVASFRFIKEGTYNRKAAMAIMISGLAGIFIATHLVTSMPMDLLRILVVVVVLYTSFMMLRSFYKAKGSAQDNETKDKDLDFTAPVGENINS